MVSSVVQKLLSLIKSHLFIFVFISISLGGGSRKILLWFMSKSVLPKFSSKSFIVFGLTFRSLIHFEFILVCGVRECSNFILLHVAVQFSQHHLLKRMSFLHCMFLPPLSKIRWPYVRGFISGHKNYFSNYFAPSIPKCNGFLYIGLMYFDIDKFTY